MKPPCCPELFWVILIKCITAVLASDEENRLFKHLLDEYSKLAIPVSHPTDILEVHLGLFMEQIVEVDERNQVLTSKVWVKQIKLRRGFTVLTIWHDHSLEWNPAKFDGIKAIRLPTYKLWTPDILIYNNANGTYDIQAETWASVNYTGNVTWFPPAVYKSACKIDVKYFPFDEQRCDLKFGSWTYDATKINLLPMNTSAKLKDYWTSGEWIIIESPCKQNRIKYPCCEDIYIDVTCTFLLRRVALYYFIYLILPNVLMSVMTVLVFYLPPCDITNCEKMQLCTCILVSMVWFLLLVTYQIPPNANNFPLIMKYLIFTMMIISTSLTLTVITLNVRHRSPSTHNMPLWVRRIFIEFLPKYIWMKRPAWHNEHYAMLMSKKGTVPNKYMDAKHYTLEEKINSYNAHINDVPVEGSELDSDSDSESILGVLGDPEENLKQCYLRPSKKASTSDRDLFDGMVTQSTTDFNYTKSVFVTADEEKRVKDDWKYVAIVLDRLFFIIYSCGVCVGTFVIFFEAPLAIEFFKQMLSMSDLNEYENDVNDVEEVMGRL